MTMTFSPLTSRIAPGATLGVNCSSRDRTPITRLIVHHTAGGSNADNVALLAGPGQPSSTYVLQTDGTLVGIIPEQYRPWTSGSFEADGPAITVETVNTTHAPEWRVSDAQIDTLVALARDLRDRYGWKRLELGTNLFGHRDWASTACPGPYLYARLPEIAERANQPTDTTPPPPPPRRRKTMIGIKIVDGEKRYTKNAGTLYATVAPGMFVQLTEKDANAIAGHLDADFANVTYAAWDAYKVAAGAEIEALEQLRDALNDADTRG